MLFNKKSLSSGSGGASEDEEEIEVSIELILAAGLDRGLRMDDTERLTIGMWVDYIVEWNNIRLRGRDRDSKDDKKIRRARQKDFDRF